MRIFAFTARALLLAAAAPAFAQSPPTADAAATAQPDEGIPEIVVTATRRAEALQDVPIAISAYSAESLNALSARTVGDLSATTPNLARTSGPTGGNDAFFFIRGIGQLDSNPANDPGVGVYIDGVYLGRLQGASLDVQDVARVEVLRGPQGTLFGRNTIGGAINITSADPAAEFGGRARLTLGSRDRIDGYAAVDLPVTDSFGVRASFSARTQDGYGRNFYTGRTFGDIETYSARAKAVWKPSETFRLTVAGDWFQGRSGTPQTILLAFNPNVGAIPDISRLPLPFPVPRVGVTPLGVPFPPDLLTDTSSNIDRNFLSVDPRLDNDNYGVSVTGELGLGAVQSKLILAWRHSEQFAVNDFDGTGYRFFDNFFDTNSDQYSAELQFFGDAFDDRLRWLVGGYAYYEDIAHNNAICLGSNLGNPFPGLPGGPTRNAGGCLRNNQVFDLEITNFAGFANATYNFTDKVSLVLGARYTTEQKFQAFDFFLDNSAGVGNLFMIPPLANIPTLSPRNPNVGVPTQYNQTFNEFTPKVGLNFAPNDDLLFYASYSRGFKSGGFNGRPNPGGGGRFAPITAYDPETLDAYEIGFKSELFDRRLRFNAAAFYSVYDGIQLLVLDPLSGFFNNQNAGTNDIKGFEIETTARPVRNLEIYLNAGYVSTDYTKINPLAGIAKSARLPVTPDWTLGLGGSYRIDLPGIGSLTPRADYSYRGGVFYGAQNGPFEFQEGFGLLNLRVTYLDRTERFSVSAFGLNVTDERYLSNAQDVTSALGVAFAQVGAPAEWGVEFGARF